MCVCKWVHVWHILLRVCNLYKWLHFCVLYWTVLYGVGFPRRFSGKESTGQCRRQRRLGFDPWVRKIPWSTARGTPLQYSCLENSMDRGAWEATAHWVTKSPTRLSTRTSMGCTEHRILRPGCLEPSINAAVTELVLFYFPWCCAVRLKMFCFCVCF